MSGSGSDAYRENEEEKEVHEVKVAEARKVVNEVVKALEKPNKPYKYRWLSRLTINEVYEGGSLGKGTTVPYNFDVDLVIRSQDITVEMLESSLSGPSNIKLILEELKMYLQEQTSGSYIIRIKHTWPRSISFVVAFHGNKEVGVDLLIAPYYETLDEALDAMRDLKKRHEDEWDEYRILLTPAVASWQTEYIAKRQPDRVKELIKRCKKWKKGVKWEHGGPPSSYLLEILMIMACEMYCTKQGRTVKDLDQYQKITDIAIGVQNEITAMVKGYKNLRLKPTPCEGLVWTSGPGRWNSCDVDDPYVMDPASFYNNLFISGMKGDTMAGWAEFAEKIGSLDLRKPLFPL